MHLTHGPLRALAQHIGSNGAQRKPCNRQMRQLAFQPCALGLGKAHLAA
jgi:hypothetical protein